MKHIYLVGGPMGVGKTTVCQILKRKLPNAVFLDGDWCWDASPFHVTEETKAMVMDNICYLLGQFIQCSAYENIIFCWVMHEQQIIDTLLSRLDTRDSGVIMQFVIVLSLARRPLYETLQTEKVNIENLTAEEAAVRLIDGI